MLQVTQDLIPNHDRWQLSLRRTVDPAALEPGRHPLLIIPGYGMNSFIFGYHPRGTSMEATLAAAGFEVWSVDLRGQGKSVRQGGSLRYRLQDLALTDVPAAVQGVLERTETGSTQVDLVGCSLGATLMFGYVACRRPAAVGSLVNLGGPLKWVRLHPILKAAFASPALVGMLPLPGVRTLAKRVLPLLRHAPWLLSIYLHPDMVDLSKADRLVETVESPNRHVNRDIARWMGTRDLWMENINISDVLPQLTYPLLSVIAYGDGIVPRENVLWPHQTMGSRIKEALEVGGPEMPVAHADLFVCDQAPQLVFQPLARWLRGVAAAVPAVTARAG